MRKAMIAASIVIVASGVVLAEQDEIDLRSWIGKDREELAEGWGEPQDLKAKKGGEVLVYEVFAGSQIVGSWTLCGSSVNLGLKEGVQKVTFWIDSDGRITKVKPKVVKLKPDPGPPEDVQESPPPGFRINHP